MFTLRGFCGAAALGIVLGASAPALAGSNDCGKGPPSWWNAPRVTYTYQGSSGRSYSAQRSYSSQRSYRAPRYSNSRSYTSSHRYAHSSGYTRWH